MFLDFSCEVRPARTSQEREIFWGPSAPKPPARDFRGPTAHKPPVKFSGTCGPLNTIERRLRPSPAAAGEGLGVRENTPFLPDQAAIDGNHGAIDVAGII
jgi:hypothetical protein